MSLNELPVAQLKAGFAALLLEMALHLFLVLLIQVTAVPVQKC